MEAAKRIREGGFRNLIAGVTGNILEDDVEEYLQAGADIVFGKPMKISWLNLLLRHLKEKGPLSQAGMTLRDNGRCMEWVVRF